MVLMKAFSQQSLKFIVKLYVYFVKFYFHIKITGQHASDNNQFPCDL
jgi:hypothetical protein